MFLVWESPDFQSHLPRDWEGKKAPMNLTWSAVTQGLLQASWSTNISCSMILVAYDTNVSLYYIDSNILHLFKVGIQGFIGLSYCCNKAWHDHLWEEEYNLAHGFKLVNPWLLGSMQLEETACWWEHVAKTVHLICIGVGWRRRRRGQIFESRYEPKNKTYPSRDCPEWPTSPQIDPSSSDFHSSQK